MTYVAAFLALAAAATCIYSSARVLFHLYRWHDRIETLEQRVQSLQGKVAADSRWSRDEIRSQVDEYVQQLGLEPADASGGDLMQAMMQMMMMQQQQPTGGDGEGVPEQQVDLGLAGRGGSEDG